MDSIYQSQNSLETQNKSLLDEIHYLEINNKRLKSVVKRFNREFNEERIRLNNDKLEAIKDLKMEVKQWKRKLGREKEKTKKNLDKALDRVEILDDAAVVKTKHNNTFKGTVLDTFSNISTMSSSISDHINDTSVLFRIPTSSYNSSEILQFSANQSPFSVAPSSGYSYATATPSCLSTTPPSKHRPVKTN